MDYRVRKVVNPHKICAEVPGSKSITNRALLIAALAEGTSHIKGVLFSDDSRHFLQALADLGFPLEINEPEKQVTVTGFGGRIPGKDACIDVGSAGTAARFLTALLGLSQGKYRILSSEQMKKRPMKELLDSLSCLGAEISYEEEAYHFPFTIGNQGSSLTEVSVDVDKSSQFLSALLISSVLFTRDFTIHVTGNHGMAYVRMTLQMMAQFGVHAEEISDHEFLIPASSCYRAMDYDIEPDLSAACYFYAMSPILSAPALVKGVHRDSMQGDIRFLSVLQEMGCSVQDTQAGIQVNPPAVRDSQKRGLQGGSFDLSSFSDQALTLAALAPFADSPVEIKGIGHLRYQECDRIQAIENNLKAMGIEVSADETSVTIQPGEPQPAFIRTYDDHRVAMAFSLPGLSTGDMVIENYLCCRKTFENYFDVLEETVY